MAMFKNLFKIKLIKNVLFAVLFLVILSSFSAFALAQQALPPTKDTTTTIVGNADLTLTPGPLPTNPTGSQAVAYWADFFASHLQTGADGVHYTKLPSPITNSANGATIGAGRYVCTGLVIASHKLAGAKVPHQDIVINMQHYWESATGGHLINYTANNHLISLVRSGDVFFQLSSGNVLDGFGRDYGHVSIVYSINIDSNGDGEMVTREANAPKISITVKFQNWIAYSYDWGIGKYNNFLFGLQP